MVGVLSAPNMEKAYAVELGSRDLQILMRHRALLFGLIGGFVLYSAFFPAHQLPALVMAGISMVGFVVLAVLVGDSNKAIFKVVVVDLVGIGILLGAVLLRVLAPLEGGPLF